MKYKPEWKGRVKLNQHNGKISIDGVECGRILQHRVEGAKSPGGMVTNAEFSIEHLKERYASMTLAIQAVIDHNQESCVLLPAKAPVMDFIISGDDR